MKCSLCGYEFNEEEALRACKSCVILKGCKLIRCPNCNFEMPPEPKWLEFFRRRKKNEKKEFKYAIRTRRRNPGGALD